MICGKFVWNLKNGPLEEEIALGKQHFSGSMFIVSCILDACKESARISKVLNQKSVRLEVDRICDSI